MLYLAVIILLGYNLVAHHHNEHIEEQIHFNYSERCDQADHHQDEEGTSTDLLFSHIQHQFGSEVSTI